MAFRSDWLDWNPANTPVQRTDRTDNRASVSSVSETIRHIEPEFEPSKEKNVRKTRYPLTDITDKRSKPGTETENLLPGICAECGERDGGTLSIVIDLTRPEKPWRHAGCYTRWVAVTEAKHSQFANEIPQADEKEKVR